MSSDFCGKRGWSVSLLAGGVFLAWALLCVCGDVVAAEWLQAELPDVRVVSDVSRKDLTEFTVRYSAFHHAFNELLAPPSRPAPASTVVLFGRESVFKKYTPKSKTPDARTVASTSELDGNALLALLFDGDRDDSLSTAFEFETTWGLRRVGYFLPVWAAQGAGEVFSSMRLKKGKCVIGLYDSRFESSGINEKWIPWSHFFEIHTGSPEYTKVEENYAYHRQAWALMHRLLIQPGATRDRFTHLAVRFAETFGDSALVQEILEEPESKFTKDISNHLHDAVVVEVPFDENGVRSSLKISPMPEADLHIIYAALLDASQRTDESDQELDRAQKIAPTAPSVKEALARRALRKRDEDGAAALYREAIASGSLNMHAYLVSAKNRIDQSASGGRDFPAGAGDNAEQAKGEIRKAIQIDNGSIEAFRMLGRAFYVSQKVTEADIAELSRAISNNADSLPVRYYRSLLNQRLGKTAEAEQDWKYILETDQTPEWLRKNVAIQWEFQRFNALTKEMNSLSKERRFGEARDILAKSKTQLTTKEHIDYCDRLDRQFEEADRWEKLVELNNQKSWTELAEGLKAFIADFPDSRETPRAKKLLGQVEKINEKKADPTRL